MFFRLPSIEGSDVSITAVGSTVKKSLIKRRPTYAAVKKKLKRFSLSNAGDCFCCLHSFIWPQGGGIGLLEGRTAAQMSQK